MLPQKLFKATKQKENIFKVESMIKAAFLLSFSGMSSCWQHDQVYKGEIPPGTVQFLAIEDLLAPIGQIMDLTITTTTST